MRTGGRTHRCSHHVGAVFLVLLLLVAVHLGGGDAAVTLRLVQVLHRHGSRSAIVSYNASQLCGDVPCGYLNVPGQKMTINAGSFLREHYNSDPANPFFPSESYDLDVSYTRSTDVLRTLQSAEGLLRGLFPNMSAFFPAVHTVDSGTDWLLISDVIPYNNVFGGLDKQWKRNVCNPMVDTLIDFATLQNVAKEALSEGYCANAEDRCDCASQLFDIGNALDADGRISTFPLLKANLEKLRAFVQFEFLSKFGYNASNERDVKMGSQGQNFVQQVLSNAQLHMQGKSTYKLYHYSAHDTTLSPVAATLRDTTPNGALPPFAQLYAFELLYDDSANAYSMRVRRGYPGQTPESDYAFAWDDFQLKCMSSDGAVYNAANNTCPYYDFQRLVDSSKPKDPAGLCYLDDEYKSLLGCPSSAGQSPNSNCQAYRKVCPAWSCGADFTLDPVTLQCVCSSASCMGLSEGNGNSSGGAKSGSGLSVGGTICVSILAFVFGVVLSSIILILWERQGRWKSLIDSMLDVEQS
ncbi:membrane-bound acid phosphatase 2 [Trypanosoma theileri]|uniref:Membrane-bound acid phosphatase 2 n=1 Tax=Trypanosoma theileri TaxID=67003 RepID=A0A1X0P7V5_9TRYP|nr:membrane-bound acid phosphatase 2 [Trypanosoma theileri]ORC92911.1 membrane-bound acid phosphatase 2 [Trypanosoma theileri]